MNAVRGLCIAHGLWGFESSGNSVHGDSPPPPGWEGSSRFAPGCRSDSTSPRMNESNETINGRLRHRIGCSLI